MAQSDNTIEPRPQDYPSFAGRGAAQEFVKADVKEQQGADKMYIPTFDDVKSGKISVVGQTPISPKLVEEIKQGNPESIKYVTNLLTQVSLNQERSGKGAVVAGTQQTMTGQRQAMTPKTLKFAGVKGYSNLLSSSEYNLPPNDAQMISDFARTGLNIKELSEQYNVNDEITQLLVDTWDRTEILAKINRENMTDHLYRSFASLEKVGRKAKAASFELLRAAFDENKTFDDLWNKEGGRARFLQDLASDRYLDPTDRKPHKELEVYLKGQLIKKYGEEKGNAMWDRMSQYTLSDGTVISQDVIPEELGKKLYDYSESLITLPEHVIQMAMDGATMTAAMELGSQSIAAWKLYRIQKARKANPGMYEGTNYNAIYRHLQDETQRKGIFRAWTKSVRFIEDVGGFRPYTLRGGLGVRQDHANFKLSIERSKEAVDRANENLNSALLSGKADEIAAAKAQKAAAIGRKNKLQFKNIITGSVPYVGTLVKDEAMLAGTQGAAEAYFGFERNEFTTALVGMGGYLGLQFIGTKGRNILSGENPPLTMSEGLRKGIRSVETLGEVLTRSERGSWRILTAGRLDEMEALLGRKVSNSEFLAFKQLGAVVKPLPESEQQQALFNASAIFKAKQNVLEGIEDPDLRAAFADEITITSGQATMINGLIALERKNAGAEGKFGDFVNQLNIQADIERSIIANTRLLKTMQDRANGIEGGVPAALQNHIDTMNAGLAQQLKEVQSRKNAYIDFLENNKKEMLENPAQAIDTEDFFANVLFYTQAKRGSNLDIEGQVIQQTFEERAAALDAAKEESIAILNERMKRIRELEDQSIAQQSMAMTLEAQAEVLRKHRQSLIALAYAPVDAFGQEVNMLPFIDQLTDEIDGLESRSLKGIFTGEYAVFTGSKMKDFQDTLNNMAKRNMMSAMGAADEGDLILRLQAKDIILEDGKRIPNPFYIDDEEIRASGDLAEMAMYLVSKDKSLEPLMFSATVSEVEMIRSYFSGEAARAGKSTGMKGQQEPILRKIADMLRRTLDDTSPEIKDALKEARQTAQGEKFDFERSPIGSKVMNAANGPERVFKETFGFNYKQNMSPADWNMEVSKLIANAVTSGSRTDTAHIKNGLQYLLEFWGGSRSVKSTQIVDGKPVVTYQSHFDMADEDSMRRLKALKEGIETQVRLSWADATKGGILSRQNALGEGATVEDYRNIDLIKTGGALDMDGVRETQEAILSQIMIKDKDGVIRPVTAEEFFDLGDIIDDVADWNKQIVKDKSLAKAYTDYASSVDRGIEVLRKSGELEIELSTKNSIFDMSSIDKNFADAPLQILNEFVLGRDPSKIIKMREQFIKGGGTADQFNKGMLEIINEGLALYAGKEIALPTFQKGVREGRDGNLVETYDLTQPQNVVNLYAKDNNFRNILSELGMEDTHIDRMRDIYILSQSYLQASGSMRSAGRTIRGISPNEIISRAFNISRGMVSPQYVLAEFAYRIMEKHKVDVLKFAAGDEIAADILYKLMDNPDTIGINEIKTFERLAKSFVTRELAKRSEGLDESVLGVSELEIQEAAPNLAIPQ